MSVLPSAACNCTVPGVRLSYSSFPCCMTPFTKVHTLYTVPKSLEPVGHHSLSITNRTNVHDVMGVGREGENKVSAEY